MPQDFKEGSDPCNYKSQKDTNFCNLLQKPFNLLLMKVPRNCSIMHANAICLTLALGFLSAENFMGS